MKTLRSTLALCAALACLIQVPALAATPSYTITGIGLGGNSSVAYDINNNGLVVGGSGSHAFQYGGMVTDIGAVVGGSSTALKVNDGGQVLISQGGGAYSIYSGGAVTSVGAVAGSNPYTLNGMNNTGRLAGTVNLSPGNCNIDYCDPAIDHAFTYRNGVMTDLGTLSGGSGSSFANSINNLGLVAGESTTSGGSQHAFLYSGGVMSDLGTLGGSYSTAYGINDLGKVVGVSDGPMGYGVTQAFLYSDGIMTGLGTLGGSYSAATDINNGGQVVGYSSTTSTEHAFLYDNGAMTDLNALLSPSSGWTLNRAYAINDNGQIVGYGRIGGKTQAFLMTPTAVPAPAAAWLFGSGLIWLAGFARRDWAGSGEVDGLEFGEA